MLFRSRRLSALGAKHVRYATRIAQDIGKGSFRPRCLLFTEWAAEPPAAADLQALLAAQFGSAVSDTAPFVGWRAYPWPDDKASLRY